MAEFKTVSGQIEGLWNAGLADAEVAGRRAGAAAAVETVWQAGEKLAAELAEQEERPRPGDFLAELRRRVGGEPGLQLTAEEWGRVHAALENRPSLRPETMGTVDGEPMSLAEWDARRDKEARQRAGLPDDGEERLTFAEWEERHQAASSVPEPLARFGPEIARDFEGERARQLAAEDAEAVFPPPEEDAVLLDGTRASDEPREALGPAFRPSTHSA